MTAGPAHGVQTPITDGVRKVNFFNGRLLTASDLRREQEANAVLRDRLGLAVGDGVASGLRVGLPPAHPAPDPVHPVVRVTAGIAVNRAGHALRLPYDVDVSLERPAGTGLTTTPAAPGGFAPCSGLPDGAPLATAGVYLLTVAPSSQAQGRALVGGLGNEIAQCGTDADAEGVQFRIVLVNLPSAVLADPRVRNRLAHLMFGTEDDAARRLALDPFGGPAPQGDTQPYGLLDQLRATALADQEVPLACLLWVPGQGILFVDEWCVRRPVAVRGADSDWPEVTSPRRRIEGQAAFQQFQAEVRDLVRLGGQAIRGNAGQRFALLPAAGLLPLASSGSAGFSFEEFFQGTPLQGPFVIDGTHVIDCLQESFLHAPYEVASQQVLRLYLVRQNLLPRADGTPLNPFMLFTTAYLRYRADGRYDLDHWNFTHFAEGS
jgi:hypothetical protein